MLRRVLLHRPDLELRRLTPSNCSDLLFDDVLWVKRARQEHDAFADTLSDRGVEVLYVGDLLAETVKDDVARSWLLDRVITENDLGRDLAIPVRSFFDAADATTVATHLIGGITPTELPTGVARGLRAAVLDDHGFVLPPLPNHMFTRDTTCWIYGGVSVNPMAMPARRRETAHLEAIYRFHPLFAGESFARWYGGVDDDHGSATIEGGDVLVIGRRRRAHRHGRAHHPARRRGPGPQPLRQRRRHHRDPGGAALEAGVHAPRHRHDHGAARHVRGLPGRPRGPPGLDAHPGRRPRRARRHPPARRLHTHPRRPRRRLDPGAHHRRRRAARPSASSGTTATTSSPSPPASSSPTSATSTPTRSSARPASRSSPSPAASWAEAAAALAA